MKSLLGINLLIVLLVTSGELNAQASKSRTLKAPPTTTSGIIAPKESATTSIKNQVPPGLQPETITPTSTIPTCIDLGIEGNKCGAEAVVFCKENPQHLNCQSIQIENQTIK